MTLQPAQFGPLQVPFDKVLARLGYAQGKTELDEQTTTIIEEEIAVSKRLILPRQVLSYSKIVLSVQGHILLEPSLAIRSQKIYELFQGCSEACGFAVTAGPHIENMRNSYIEKKEVARAVVLDAIGSVMAERLADITHTQVREEALRRGMVATMRYSPGYSDWALSGQKDFLSWLSAASIGIRLNENFQMIPEKSVSAIIGLKER